MYSLPCPLSVLSPALQARTLFNHTVFGVVRYLTSPAELPVARHPLEFAFLLGLSKKLVWYQEQFKSEQHPVSASTMLSLAGRHWKRSLYDFDAPMLALRFSALPQELRAQAMRTIYGKLGRLEDPMKELATTSNLPREVYDRLNMSLASLEAALVAKDPMMPQHLRNSHAVLVSYPETVNLLNDEETARLIDAAEIHVNVEIVKAVAKGKGKSSASLAKIGVSDL